MKANTNSNSNSNSNSILLIKILLLTISFSLVKCQTPTRPVIPSNFTSSLYLKSNLNGAIFTGSGFFYYSDEHQIYKLETLNNDEFPGYHQYFVQIATSNGSYQITNGVCRSNEIKFADMFSWLSFADYVGVINFEGTDCDLWELSNKFEVLQVCVLTTDANRPLFNNFTISTKTEYINSEFDFPVDGVWKAFQCPDLTVPDRCFTSGFICPKGSVENMEMIRFHPSNDYTLGNRNLADIQGDCSFLCKTVNNSVHSTNQIISQYSVQVNTSWGQYGLCNNDNCVGGNDYTVGHEAAYGLAPGGGQCSDNPSNGNWYSLRDGAMCQGTDSIGDGGCAWKMIELVKSISLDCLESVGFLAACQEDNFDFPFANSAIVLGNALNQTDSSLGGCPPLPPYYYTEDNLNNEKNSYSSALTDISEHFNTFVKTLFNHYNHYFSF